MGSLFKCHFVDVFPKWGERRQRKNSGRRRRRRWKHGWSGTLHTEASPLARRLGDLLCHLPIFDSLKGWNRLGK